MRKFSRDTTKLKEPSDAKLSGTNKDQNKVIFDNIVFSNTIKLIQKIRYWKIKLGYTIPFTKPTIQH